jgi:hypothetical protein
MLRTFSFLGGSTRAVVPDQLKSAVTIACRYDPLIQLLADPLPAA